jgi:hypothetical protein
MSGLHTRIARKIDCEGRYGTFEKYLHRNLLWHASDLKLQKIEYDGYVPSWSWMAYDGSIRFLALGIGSVEWARNIRYDKECDCRHVLIADVGKFQDCRMELEGNRYALTDLSNTKRGWIRYDVKDGNNLLEEYCVVVGKTTYGEDDCEGYYILVVRPTSVDNEYERVGMGRVSSNCIVRKRINARVV